MCVRVHKWILCTTFLSFFTLSYDFGSENYLRSSPSSVSALTSLFLSPVSNRKKYFVFGFSGVYDLKSKIRLIEFSFGDLWMVVVDFRYNILLINELWLNVFNRLFLSEVLLYVSRRSVRHHSEDVSRCTYTLYETPSLFVLFNLFKLRYTD